MTPNGSPQIAGETELAEISALAALIVRTLNLEVSVDEIDHDGALYGEGLGLDSIDMLEISLAVSQAYGVNLRADDTGNVTTFQSLRTLNHFIQVHRAS